ncbi:transposase, Mutator family protein [Mycobacterium xenopi 4042]|uniref:Mutator family transposase n=1 Tax=Mycobacterium xenopi 4042 TaxID=1299334 RepID=X8BGV9_MYCXE|nr:transposase, Mutator family protein [Mycobacterium xenopi 4042]
MAIPKLRQGSYFPDWLLERRKRAERALTSVVATCYLLGVSTRRMERLVETLGVTRLSKSQVSIMAKELDEQVEAFRTRPLDAGPYTFVAADALVLKVREAGRVVGVHTLIATGVNAEGYREILGVQVSSAEDGAGWLAFFRDLVARGLSGWRWSPATPTPAWSPRSGHLARSGLAALPHPLREQPDGGHPEVLLAVGAHSAALGLRPARRRIGCCPIRSSPRRIVGQAPKVAEHLDAARRICWRSPLFPNRSGAKSGATIPRNGSTKKSGAGPTSWASSPTGPRSSASSVPCWPNNTTNGSKDDATWALTCSPAPAQH